MFGTMLNVPGAVALDKRNHIKSKTTLKLTLLNKAAGGEKKCVFGAGAECATPTRQSPSPAPAPSVREITLPDRKRGRVSGVVPFAVRAIAAGPVVCRVTDDRVSGTSVIRCNHYPPSLVRARRVVRRIRGENLVLRHLASLGRMRSERGREITSVRTANGARLITRFSRKLRAHSFSEKKHREQTEVQMACRRNL
ncbi:hypothetical protein EVAR_82565_1 [Eumeta japonica]|uniref:Uncharacterized protein n=1 Tax=Eumeta variegata TaxID=151549 RepID=A0A4C1UWF5_EUMVA|nr:hypothetical protein EVAR_82565_1 [Eumeta japonica]